MKIRSDPIAVTGITDHSPLGEVTVGKHPTGRLDPVKHRKAEDELKNRLTELDGKGFWRKLYYASVRTLFF